MRYEGIVYRPPSEAYSFIVQVTVGCAHNKCSFCSMYKNKRFRIRNLQEVFKDLEEGKTYYSRVDKIFLADGDALCLPTEHLKKILLKIKELFPKCNRVGVYAAPKDILRKSLEELKELKNLGLGIIYLGLESGSEEILRDINKGVTQEEMIQAGKKVKESGIPLSLTVISGIGGREKLEKNGIETGKVISQINPDFVGLLTLMLEPGTEITNKVANGDFNLLTPQEVMIETKILLQNMEVTNCLFRSNHASNYVSLKGTLPFDKEKLINTIEQILKEDYSYKSEIFRGL